MSETNQPPVESHKVHCASNLITRRVREEFLKRFGSTAVYIVGLGFVCTEEGFTDKTVQI